ncbi:hypothetical protein HKBW3S34_01454, partial [Candidatus Hakubella thermalkaliphila]
MKNPLKPESIFNCVSNQISEKLLYTF